MTKLVINEELKSSLESYLKKNSSAELLNTYLFFIEQRYNIQPVLFSKDKMIYQSAEDAIRLLEQENKIWHETEIKIGFSNLNVNEQSKKIYICPFSGKVFADNTHPNPQDAIYDWVSKCPENTERVGGLRVKRFYISEDPEVMKSYIAKVKYKAPITKKVFSSVLSGKLFGSKEGVMKDFKQNYLHPMSLAEVQNQNKYQIEEHFLAFIQKHLNEEKVGDFVEALLRIEEFVPYVEKWMD